MICEIEFVDHYRSLYGTALLKKLVPLIKVMADNWWNQRGVQKNKFVQRSAIMETQFK